MAQDSWYLAGTAVVLAGVSLRLWAFRSLGRYFRTVLAVQEGQEIINRGPYRFIRHPSYAGAMLAFTGIGFGLGGWAGLAVMAVFTLAGYRRRIELEERMMIACFQDKYLGFMGKTKKLLPFIY